MPLGELGAPGASRDSFLLDQGGANVVPIAARPRCRELKATARFRVQ